MKPEDFEKTDDIERRTHTVEMRVKEPTIGKKSATMEGYAANFNSLSEDLGGFRELLMPGCFSEALKTSDVCALFNHEPSLILGRNTSGTLRLFEDERGLKWEVDPDMEISYVKDLSRSMARRDIHQCSFGFSVAEDGCTWAKDSGGMWIRSIFNVSRLYDVSPVTYPAYTSTSCAVRSLLQLKSEEENAAKIELEREVEGERQRKINHRRRELEMLAV
jgi:HK97 family phage prohead protease